MAHVKTVDLAKLAVSDDQVKRLEARLEQAEPASASEHFWPEQFTANGNVLFPILRRLECS